MTDLRQRRSPFFSLRGRLFFLICLATLPALLFTFFVARNERADAIARTEKDALHLAQLAAREHAHQIRGARELLVWLGARLTRDGLASPIVTDSSFLRALLSGHPQLANIGVLASDGTPLTSAYPLRNRQSWRDHPAYRAAIASDSVATGTYLVSPIFDRPTLNHAYAVHDADRHVIAVAFNGLDLGWFDQMSRGADNPEGFAFHIVDVEGNVVASGNAPPSELPSLPQLDRGSDVRLLGEDSAGVMRYVVAVPLAEMHGLFVAVSLPYDTVVDQANAAFYRALGALALLTLFNVIAVFVAAEIGILRSVRSLASVARRFGAGDMSARARSPKGESEFSALVNEFNTMAETVERRHREAQETQSRLRALASRLHVAREAEAARISRELHDEIGQLLTSLKIGVSHLSSLDSARLREHSVEMSRQIDAAIDFVRRIAAELRPGVLDRLGLVAALEWQATEIERRTGLTIAVDSDLDDRALSETLSVTLFRIAQEALTNVVRHANAHTVEVTLRANSDTVTLIVQDDGRGITRDEAARSESLGIIGMHERTTLISGLLSIVGGDGTTVTVTAPLTHAIETDDADTPR
jgi:signal transduction histidine kinase